MKFKTEDDQRPVVIYDCEIKKPILIFKNQWMAEKYLFSDGKRRSIINQCLLKKRTCYTSDLNCKITLRFANNEQIKLIGDNDYFVIDDSRKKFNPSILVSYNSTRGVLYNEHVIKKHNKSHRL